jgi:pyridoxine 4-dehydrogenase
MPKLLNKEVGPIGYGLASLTTPPEFPPEDQALECLRTAADLGCLLWNAGEFYGPPTYNSLVLLNKFYTKYPEYADKVILSVKGAMLPTFSPMGDPEFVKKSVDNCISQLGRKGKISMYETARIDSSIPLETQLNTLKELVDEGKIESISLTEVSANTIREASKIVDIAAVEIELSVWCTDPLHNGILSTCAELKIPVMA